MIEVQTKLENFCRLDHVVGAAVFDRSGKELVAFYSEESATERLSKLVADSFGAGGAFVSEIGRSSVSQMYLEFESEQVTLEGLSSNRCLVVLAGSGANLGRIRLELRKNKTSIEKALTES